MDCVAGPDDPQSQSGNPGGFRIGRADALRRLAFLAGSLLWQGRAGAEDADWTVVKHDGIDYVTGSDIKEFYGFEQYGVRGKEVMFQVPGFWMRGRIGSPEIQIKGIKFVLSFPLAQQGREVLFSKVDLVKLIDPVLRPDYIRGAPDFNTVVLDAGHGGHDTGARGPYGTEKDFALKTVFRLAAVLKAKGYKTVLTRTKDHFVTLGGRVAIANKVPSAIFVSIHYNHSDNRSARGIETFALAPAGTVSTIKRWAEPNLGQRRGNLRDAENIALATAVHNGVIRRLAVTKPVDRGIKRARFAVISGITMPGILLEGGFVAHPVEGMWIATPSYQQALAEGVAVGILNFRRALQSEP